ncbi:hypothetical protein KVR01_001365 [Diaporthe batatas]|uniref:uncharacterized protein n=1 Tax=Diaporthe batatas TaxID=748121 RepID=UPI001D04F894|nr:uncharacterized protein KVR01_001365 [Diaporthe batatas]KAG8168616.1 hypothetical protein KVR01_001365 [Diaporthe batatas]
MPSAPSSDDSVPRSTSQLIESAGLLFAAPKLFPEQRIADIPTMVNTNINGIPYTSHAFLNEGGMPSATKGADRQDYGGYWARFKAPHEALTNILRNELKDTDIKVLAVRSGVVATKLYKQRVQNDKGSYEGFIDGYEPLVADDTAAVVLERPERLSVKTLGVFVQRRVWLSLIAIGTRGEKWG